MQHTTLPNGDTARRTGDGEKLFWRQVFHSHLETIRKNQSQNCSILNIMHREPGGVRRDWRGGVGEAMGEVETTYHALTITLGAWW
jgi:hypothetical protein